MLTLELGPEGPSTLKQNRIRDFLALNKLGINKISDDFNLLGEKWCTLSKE
jgi:hypothetical protein